MKPDLSAIRARLDAQYLNAAPWLVGGNDVIEGVGGCADSDLIIYIDIPTERVGPDGISVLFDGDWGTNADAEFIAHAREDVPDLLALVESLEAEIERLRAGLAEYNRGSK